MGLDLLDIVFRLEKAFSIKVFRADFDTMLGARGLQHLTAGEIYDYVTTRVRDRWPANPGGFFEVDLHCFSCGYNLRGLHPDGACPECGNPLEGFEPYVWRGVCHVLEAAVGAEPRKIRRETRLVHDLRAGL
jgi:hypothetical protein